VWPWIMRAAQWIFLNRVRVEKVADAVTELVENAEAVPSEPLTFKDVENQQKQITDATSHKVVKLP
jgi:hypothetical protein